MLRLLKFLIPLAVIIGGTIVGTFFYLNHGNVSASAGEISEQASKAPEPVPSPIFSELEPFTVTLYGETRNRILYTAITLRVSNESSRAMISEYMPEVRDRILKVLSTQNTSTVQTPDGRQQLAETIKNTLSQPFAAQLPSPGISDVLFTAFVVQ